MAATCIPTSTVALYNMVRSVMSTTQPDVDVLLGPSIDDIGQDVVAIGIAADDASLDSSLDIAGLRTDRETFDLVNMVRSWNGDPELEGRMSRAFELFEEVAALITADPMLNGTVARARISNISYLPSRLPEGAVATVTFRVRIDAFTG